VTRWGRFLLSTLSVVMVASIGITGAAAARPAPAPTGPAGTTVPDSAATNVPAMLAPTSACPDAPQVSGKSAAAASPRAVEMTPALHMNVQAPGQPATQGSITAGAAGCGTPEIHQSTAEKIAAATRARIAAGVETPFGRHARTGTPALRHHPAPAHTPGPKTAPARTTPADAAFFVKGTVTDATATGLADIEVNLYTAAWDSYASTTTDGSGNYSIGAVAGDYYVEFYDSTDTYVSGYYSAGGYQRYFYDATTVTVDASDVTANVTLPKYLKIGGTVSNGAADPIESIDVTILDLDGYYIDSATTNASGKYSVTLAPGDFVVYFEDASGTYASGYYKTSGFTYDFSDASTISLTTDDAVADITLPAALHITGTVTGTAGAPLAGIYVEIDEAAGSYINDTTTETDGTFSVAVNPGSYNVFYGDPDGNYASGYWRATGFTYDWRIAGVVKVTAADATADVNLPVAIHIKGKVTRSGGVALKDIEVTANGEDGWYRAVTAADGTFSVAVGPGTYMLSFADPDEIYGSGYYSSAGFTYWYESATPVAVGSVDVTGKNVTLPLAIHISGTVTAAGVGGLEYIDIEASATGSNYYYGYTSTDSDGNYSVTVAPGAYTLRFTDGSEVYGSGYYATAGFTYNPAAATSITVASASVTGKNITLPLAVHLVGTVTNAGSDPLSGIQVSALDPTTGKSDSYPHSTDGDGTYSIAVAPGAYDLWFYDGSGAYGSGYHGASGFTYDPGLASPVTIAATDVTTNITLPGAVHIQGKVTNAAHDAIADITVNILTASASYYDSRQTDGEGNYSVAVAPGSYVVQTYDDSEVYGNGYYSTGGFTYDSSSATVLDVSSSDATADIELPAALHIQGTVTNGSHSPLAGILVTTNDKSGVSVVTEADGKYSLPVSPGHFSLYFSDELGIYGSGYYSTGGFTYNPASASSIDVTSTDVTGRDVSLPSAIHIKGKVSKSGGVGLPGIKVDTDSGYGTTASDGTYSIAVAPGSHLVYFYDQTRTYGSGYYSTAGFTYLYSSATPVVVVATDVTGKNVTLPTALHIKGTVTKSGGGGLGGVFVQARSSSGTSWSSTSTSISGTYSVAVAPGSYTLFFYEYTEKYGSGYYSTAGFTYLEKSASSVTVSTADVTGKNAVLPLALHIKGKATRAGGGAVQDVNVSAVSAGYENGASTGFDGNFSVAVAPGSYTLGFHDYAGVYASGFWSSGGFVYNSKTAGLISVTSADVTGKNVVLPHAIFIKGTVTGASDQLLKTIEVDGSTASGSYSNWMTTDINGRYALEVAPSSSYKLWFRDHTGTNGAGYYSSGGFVYSSDAASAVPVVAADVTGINVKMIAASSLVFPASTYKAIAPARVLDTRPSGGGHFNIGLTGVFVAGTVRTFAVASAPSVGGLSGPVVPWNAVAVTGNLTIVGETAPGLIALGPTMTPTGAVTTINFVTGDIRANNVTVGLAPDGSLGAVYRSSTVGATVHLIFDVTGFFTPDTAGATYHTLAPGRILDSRPTTSGHTNIGLTGKFANKVVRTFNVAGVKALGWASALVPAGATAVTGNLTVTAASSVGYVALGPTMTTTPSTSTLNVAKGANVANGVTVALSAGKLSAIWMGTTGSSADVIFDVTGYFTADMTGRSYHAIVPARLLNTSITPGLVLNKVSLGLVVAGVGAIPADAAGISGNLTVVNPSSAGFAFISPATVASPTSSTVNAAAHQTVANGFDVALSGGNVALIWCGTVGSSTHLQLDVTGYWK
jgi:hypothetical protein